MKTPLSKSETTNATNCKVIRDGEAERRDARWQNVTFTQFLALKRVKCQRTFLAFFTMSGVTHVWSDHGIMRSLLHIVT